MEELKKCPFCGGEAEVEQHNFCVKECQHTYGIRCKKCNSRTYQFYVSAILAIKAWNARVKDGEIE